MIDTCQANTMYSKIYSPNILSTGSSEFDENSYSVCLSTILSPPSYFLNAVLQHENDNDIGVAVIDSFTHHILQFMEGINKTSHASMQDLVRSLSPLAFSKIAHQISTIAYSSRPLTTKQSSPMRA